MDGLRSGKIGLRAKSRLRIQQPYMTDSFDRVGLLKAPASRLSVGKKQSTKTHEISLRKFSVAQFDFVDRLLISKLDTPPEEFN